MEFYPIFPSVIGKVKIEEHELIKKKYGFNLPISHQYFYYLNDLSLISYHSKNDKKFNYYDEVKYGGFIILNMKNIFIH